VQARTIGCKVRIGPMGRSEQRQMADAEGKTAPAPARRQRHSSKGSLDRKAAG
jgi:hypothetical protein